MRFCDCGTGVPLPAREPRAEDWIDSASDSSLSAVDAGEPFALAALLTLDNVDLPFGGFFRLMPPEGVVFLEKLAVLLLGRGATLPARDTLGVPPLGVPGPIEACLARPLDAAGAFGSPVLTRGNRFGTLLVPGPAECSR